MTEDSPENFLGGCLLVSGMVRLVIWGPIREGVTTRSALCAHDSIANFFDENRRCRTMKLFIVNTLIDYTSDCAWHCNHPLKGSVAKGRNFIRIF